MCSAKKQDYSMSHGHRHSITSRELSMSDLTPFFRGSVDLELSTDARERIVKCRTYLDEKISKAVAQIFDARPGMLVEELGLRNPIYRPTAAYGHFGRPGFSWEATPLLEKLQAACPVGNGAAKTEASANGASKNGASANGASKKTASKPVGKKADDAHSSSLS